MSGSPTSTVSATDARATLPEILDRVEAGEEVTLTRHGKPVAVLLRPDALVHRRISSDSLMAAQRVREATTTSGTTERTIGARTADELEQWVAEVRSERRH